VFCHKIDLFNLPLVKVKLDKGLFSAFAKYFDRYLLTNMSKNDIISALTFFHQLHFLAQCIAHIVCNGTLLAIIPVPFRYTNNI